MAELLAKTALRRNKARVEMIGQLEIRDNPSLSIAWIARRLDGDLAAVEHFLGAKLPLPGVVASTDIHRAVSCAREQWLVIAPWAADFSDRLKAAAGASASVCDQSDGWFALEIFGGTVEALLERLCDLDTAKLLPGFAAATSIAHLRVIVMRLPEGLVLLGPGSSAQSLHHAVLSAACSIA